MLFSNNHLYIYKAGKLADQRDFVHPLLVLGFDVYTQPVDQTLQQLKDLNVDLTLMHEENFEGRPTYVVGAKQGDLQTFQFWIDKERLYFVRLLRPSEKQAGAVQDVRFDDYKQVAGGGWLAERVAIIAEGKVVFEELYSDIKINPTLSETLFNPEQFVQNGSPLISSRTGTQSGNRFFSSQTCVGKAPHNDGYALRDKRCASRLESLMNALFEGAYFVDNQRQILAWNEGAFFIGGYRRDEVARHRCSDNILVHVDDRGTELCTNECPLQKTLQDGEPHQASVFLRHKLGYRVPVSIRIVPIYGEDAKIAGAVEVFRVSGETSHWKQRIEELEKVVFIDLVTFRS